MRNAWCEFSSHVRDRVRGEERKKGRRESELGRENKVRDGKNFCCTHMSKSLRTRKFFHHARERKNEENRRGGLSSSPLDNHAWGKIGRRSSPLRAQTRVGRGGEGEGRLCASPCSRSSL